MSEVNYITAKNLIDEDNGQPHPLLDEAALRNARQQAAAIGKSIRDILNHAKRGAMDLRGGDYWSENIVQFETLSMIQARNLAKFQVRTSHPKLGKHVFRARQAFVEFRESVRLQIIGNIYTDTTKSVLEETIRQVAETAAHATHSLKQIETALAKG